MNAGKKGRKNGKFKKTSKIISIVLILSMLLGNILAVNAETTYEGTAQTQSEISDTFTPSDPLEYMQDPVVETLPQTPTDLTNLPIDPENPALSGDSGGGLQLDKPVQDNGSTDRYIVKYKPGKKDSFKTKMGKKVANGKALGLNKENSPSNKNNKDNDNKNSNAYTNNGKSKGSGTNKKSTLETNDWEILTLNEKTLPSAFAADIKASQADADIEYIQPDYALSLDSIDENSAPSDNKINTETVTSGQPDEAQAVETPADNSVTAEPAPSENETVEETSSEDVVTAQTSIENPTSQPNADIIVAVIDTGMDINHSDLAGYIDTADMWDFTQNTNEVYSSANPLEYAHATHIGGTIANTARENGVTNIKILPLRVFNNGVAYTSAIMEAVDYAVSKGATIINCSFGSTADNPALEEVIGNSDALFVCAVGNNRRDLTESPSYPSCYDLSNIISVASVNADGGFSYFSNYGANVVDITALGREVMNSLPENQQGTMTGTSMSAGYVTAVAAVVDAKNIITTDGLKTRLLDTADKLSNLQDKVVQGRRVNLANAINSIVQTVIIQNNPADDSDITGYQPNQSELFELFSNKSIKKTAAGSSFTLCLMDDGTVWAWGDNSLGQLGNGNTAVMKELAQVTGLSSIKDIAAGTYHSLALATDGTVWAWGDNTYGKLGDGTTTSKTVPVQVTGLTNIIAVAAGIYHSLALQSDGTVWAWGYNAYGQLGNGTTTNSSVPVKITSLSNITAITAGEYFSVAVKSNDTVLAWGSNVYGFLGDGTTTTKYSPVPVLNLTGITAVSSRNAHTIARKSDGTIWTWGYNAYGQLGDGTTTSRYAPVQITALSSVKEISVGGYHSLAVKTDGSLYTWGYNGCGEVGNGNTTNVLSPYLLQSVNNVKNVSAGYYHSMALTNSNDIWSWGLNNCGQLGNGNSGIYKKSPVILNVSIAVKKLEGGPAHSMALDTSGNIWVTGQSLNGELGTGNTTQVATFTKNANITSVKDINVGCYHGLAVGTDGTVSAWGYNGYGELGNGNTTNSLSPVKIPNFTGVKAVAAGVFHSLALKDDGTVWAWGNNAYGQLGTGNTTNSSVPVQVPGLINVIAITSGEYFSVALTSDGKVWAWGSNAYGFLGDGTTVNKSSPVQVLNLTGITAIASKNAHTLAIKNNDTVWAWGFNCYGQLGDGTTTSRSAPVQVPGLSGIKEVSAGAYHSGAIKSDGTLYTWGFNDCGQLGDGTQINRNAPQLIKNVNAVTLGLGYYHSIAYTSTNQVLSWGNNKNNQIGIDFNICEITPLRSQLYKDAVGDTANDAVVNTLSGTAITAGDYVNNITDKDWYAFTSTTSSQYTIKLSTVDPNIKMTVYDANMSSLYSGSSTTISFTANQKYYVCTEYTQNTSFTESWCDVIVSPVALTTSSVTKNITTGNDVVVICSLTNITTFSGIVYRITYNPTQVDLVDFAAQTVLLNVSVGTVADTNLEIVTYSASTGIITFKVNKTITTGNMWSGAVTILRFKAKITGSTTVSFDKT